MHTRRMVLRPSPRTTRRPTPTAPFAPHHKATNAEARGLEAALPGVPFIGMFVGGEFGPRGGFVGIVGDEDEEGLGYEPGQWASHSYHTAAQPHGLPRVYAQSFCSVVTMFG